MKASIKPSGRIAEIESLRIKGSNRTYYPQELDILPIEKDWQQYRIQAAIAAMHTIAQSLGSIDYNKDLIAKYAVELADALVSELKKGGEHD